MNTIVAIVGGSGSGKTTILNHLSAQMNIPKIITQTTRNIREGEINGVDYYFKDSPLSFFKEELVEHDLYQNNWYGTSVNEVKRNLELNNVISAAVTEPGLIAFREKMKELNVDNVIAFKLLSPSKEVQRERLIKRGDNHSDIAERMSIDDDRVLPGLTSFEEGKGLYNEVIINDDFEKTIQNIIGVFRIKGVI